MNKIRASAVKCTVISSPDAGELAVKVNEWMSQSPRAELIGPPQFQVGPSPHNFAVMICYTEMSAPSDPPAPCD